MLTCGCNHFVGGLYDAANSVRKAHLARQHVAAGDAAAEALIADAAMLLDGLIVDRD